MSPARPRLGSFLNDRAASIGGLVGIGPGFRLDVFPVYSLFGCPDMFRDNGRGARVNLRMQFWLVKQEPEDYSWNDFVNDRRTTWTGVRNFQARNNLRAMKKGDRVLFYHSVSEKQVVGIAQVSREAYPDPTATEGDWSCVDLIPLQALAQGVSLETIKADKILKDILLVRQSRLSVLPLTSQQFKQILKLGKTKPPGARN